MAWFLCCLILVQGGGPPLELAPQAELMEELAQAPAGTEARLAALRELFVAAGAAPRDVQILDLKPVSERRQESRLKELRSNLEEVGATPLDIESILAAEAKQLERPGQNLVVDIPGKSERVLVLATYVDAPLVGDGVVNNWSGCVLLANLYQALRDSKPRHTLRFVAFGGEALGCAGSEDMAAGLDQEATERLDAMISFQCFGLAEPAGWRRGSSDGLEVIAGLVARRLGFPFKVRVFSGLTCDANAFKRREVPTLFLDGIPPEKARILNTLHDRIDAVDADRFELSYRFLVELVRAADRYEQPLRWEVVANELGLEVAEAARRDLTEVSAELGVGEKAPPGGKRPKQGQKEPGQPEQVPPPPDQPPQPPDQSQPDRSPTPENPRP